MDCKQAYRLMKQFHNHSLETDVALAFIDHTMNCKNCKEDLSIYYIIEACNGDSEPSTYDFIALVEKDMAMRKKQIDNHTSYVVFKMILWTSANLAVFLTMLSWIMSFI